jgi:pimeloyl-ACP methyl ester carboxylesterase
MVPPAAADQDALLRCFDTTLGADDRLAAIRQAFFAPGNDASVWLDGWDAVLAEAQGAAGRAVPREAWWDGGVAPILVIQGADDVIAPPANAAALATAHPDRVRVTTLPNAGHAALPEQPAAIATAILAWLGPHWT